jgi:hypothetical protein
VQNRVLFSTFAQGGQTVLSGACSSALFKLLIVLTILENLIRIQSLE